MISRTADMFDNMPPIARRTDPVTSKRAAVITDKTTRIPDKEKLRQVIARYPGRTSTEYSDILEAEGMPKTKAQRMPTRRVSDLLKDGSVRATGKRKCTVTGFDAQTYEVTA